MVLQWVFHKQLYTTFKPFLKSLLVRTMQNATSIILSMQNAVNR